MSEYPEALIEKVAAAIRGAYAASVGYDICDWECGVVEWMGEAIAALDALGLREQLADAWHDGITSHIGDANPHGETSFDRANRERRENS